ncbi:DoxX family membrane protein [Paracoccaceae bacterium Fryx2]|nr:DoxX family membrane protein [Paracoccaceae bacterium Fryx2]
MINLTGRVLLALLFALGAVQKGLDPAPVQGLLAASGLPGVLIWPAAVFDAVVAVALVTGPGIRVWALLAAGYCVLTSWFHLIPADPWQMSIFVKNWAIAGGLMVLASQPRT